MYLRLVKKVDRAKQKKIKATPYSKKNMNIMKGSESWMILPYPALHSMHIKIIINATVMVVAMKASKNQVNQLIQFGRPIIFNNSYRRKFKNRLIISIWIQKELISIEIKAIEIYCSITLIPDSFSWTMRLINGGIMMANDKVMNKAIIPMKKLRSSDWYSGYGISCVDVT